jgi:hypothetical protein
LALLSQLGATDPAETRLIKFDLDRADPQLPSLVTFQIPIKIWNIIVHHCIIEKGTSTFIMPKIVWQKIGSPELIPSTITLRDYDNFPSQQEGMYKNVLVELGGKTIHINIEFINTQLDYNILLDEATCTPCRL